MKELELGEAKNVAGVQDGIAKLSVREKEVFALAGRRFNGKRNRFPTVHQPQNR
jgi:hypothetical protein